MEEGKTEVKIDNNPDKLKIMEKIKENPWMISTILLGVVVIGVLVLMVSGGITGNVISVDAAGQKLIDFAKSGGVELQISEINDKDSFYEVTYSVNGKESGMYITKDGKYIIEPLISLTETEEESNLSQEEKEQKEVPKSDKPEVELFVMTYCPYGTQAEKGIIPALETLGSRIEGNIRFVHYFMHGDKEEQETYRQLCIREEQSTKYTDYLTCFLEAGDSESCLTKLKIDKTKLESCITNKAKDYYNSDSELSNSYSVQGSPTLIINGVQASSSRDPASYLKIICSAFTTAPEECNKQLSSESPSPGFGSSISSGGSAAQCS